ncbi:MAG: hypothetical protein ACRD2X_07295, partial [Vicinamibacteraceae bacterium]
MHADGNCQFVKGYWVDVIERRVEGDAVDNAVSRATKPIDIRPSRILVVEDDEDNAEMLQIILQLMGHEVFTAHDGLEAMRAAA